MVKRNKITVSTDNSGWKAPKKRKPRKPMSDEQKAAASERLAKAREARAEKNPDYGMSGLADNLHNLPDEYPLSPKKVRQWIKTQKELLRSEKQAMKQNIKGSIAQAASHEGYIRSMQKYLRDGDWVDVFYGEHQEKKIGRRCVAQAYYWYGPKKGQPKYDVGVFYPLLGGVYTQEMLDKDNSIPEHEGRKSDDSKGKNRKRDKGPVGKKKSKAS